MKIDIFLGNEKSYKVHIEELTELNFSGNVAVVTNPKVAGLHLGYLLNKLQAKNVFIISIPDGEQYKNLQTIENILENCFVSKLDRKSTLIAFGGGVIGDMTGFAASLYQRGIDFVQIPTTLLSQVDASVGGKTGVNNKFGKNLIGAFWQPKAVYIDSYFLNTLPKREFGAGIAEVIKMAVTFNLEFFEWLECNDLSKKENIDICIAKSVETKASVVSQDERESGIRAALNYGHTFGHVIEHETNFTQFLHGEAVGIGMVMANSLAVEIGLMSDDDAQRIKKLLDKYDIPTEYKIKNIESFYNDFYLDKKSMDTKIKFILPKSIGGCEMRDDISKDKVLQVLARFA
jgi:3-dehydroquinate synthase